MLTSRRVGKASASRTATGASVLVLSGVAFVTLTTVMTLAGSSPALAQDPLAMRGVSDTSCVGGFTTFNCVTRWGPAGDPYVRHIPGPVDEAEQARLVARDRKWLARCNPIVERDRYGVGRLRYTAPGCEFGVGED